MVSTRHLSTREQSATCVRDRRRVSKQPTDLVKPLLTRGEGPSAEVHCYCSVALIKRRDPSSLGLHFQRVESPLATRAADNSHLEPLAGSRGNKLEIRWV